MVTIAVVVVVVVKKGMEERPEEPERTIEIRQRKRDIKIR